jgi:hypothetical protein
MDTMTARPTKTVDARNAGDRMEAKLSRRPTHRTDSASEAAAADSVRLPAENDFCLKIFVQ